VETQQDIRSLGLIAPIAGHAGVGNFHTQPMIDRNNPKDMEAVETFMERLTARAIRMEGTCRGEHGIGQGKRKYLKAELGDGLNVMRSIKQALDPLDIMNPGKILPA
jgi:D-lactate dehydrogenase (cytochrome)